MDGLPWALGFTVSSTPWAVGLTGMELTNAFLVILLWVCVVGFLVTWLGPKVWDWINRDD